MRSSRREFMQIGLSLVGAAMAGNATVQAEAQFEVLESIDAERHVLNRLTWGARPDDLARIQQMGIEAYIDWQLDYENIPDSRIDEFLAARRILTAPPDELRRIIEDQRKIFLETVYWGRLYRAVYSERQLYERMVEFWTDHFNVPIYEFVDTKLLHDRDAIRLHALGRFRDLLFASSRSPAMLDYLDNNVNRKERPNENFARELMELHTLGVDGGYTEQDVVEVARAFTGWTAQAGWEGYSVFNANLHDTDPKTALGVNLPGGRGIEDGLQVLDILARHPSTAHFISRKLVQRFVSDDAPQTLVDSTTQVFTETDGDIRKVMRHILTSDTFMGAKGQKFRRPLEYMVAMARTLYPGISIENSQTLISVLEPLGHVPYGWEAPNGYPDAAGAWINTNALLNRWNMAMRMSWAGEGQLPGVALNLDALIPQAETVGALVDAAIHRILGMAITPDDRQSLIAYVSRDANADEAVTAEMRNTKLPGLVGLLLASPYFQWC